MERSNYYDDRRTFEELRKNYWQSLGPLGRWHNYLVLRGLEGIEHVEVCRSVAVYDKSLKSY